MSRDTINHVRKNGVTFLNEARDKYTDLADTLQEAAGQSKRAIHRFRKVAGRSIEDSAEAVREAAIVANRQVRKNPWAYVSGALAAGLLIGFVAGRNSAREPWQR